MPHVAIFFDCIRQKKIDGIKFRAFVTNSVCTVVNNRKIYKDSEGSIRETVAKKQCVEHISRPNRNFVWPFLNYVPLL